MDFCLDLTGHLAALAAFKRIICWWCWRNRERLKSLCRVYGLSVDLTICFLILPTPRCMDHCTTPELWHQHTHFSANWGRQIRYFSRKAKNQIPISCRQLRFYKLYIQLLFLFLNLSGLSFDNLRENLMDTNVKRN